MKQRGRFSITGIDRSDYMVKNLARAIEFYRDVLGLEPEPGATTDQGTEYWLADGSTFGLWIGDDVIPFQPGNSVLFAVDELDEAVAAMKARGTPILLERETPFCNFASINDSEGNTVTLHKRKATR
jgi:predicted enzyme related to lactoylglutathione lyase